MNVFFLFPAPVLTPYFLLLLRELSYGPSLRMHSSFPSLLTYMELVESFF